MTALSSKVFRNSGEPLDEGVEMLARRCRVKAVYGESWVFPVPEPEPARPNAIDMLFLLLFDAPGVGGMATDSEDEDEVEEEELLKSRGFSISTKDFLLEEEGEAGVPALLGSSIFARFGAEARDIA